VKPPPEGTRPDASRKMGVVRVMLNSNYNLTPWLCNLPASSATRKFDSVA